jgi:hypothetical protein
VAAGVVLVSAAGASRTVNAPRVTVTKAKLHYVGEVNLAALASSARLDHQRLYRQGARLGASPSGSKYHVVDQAILRHRLRAGTLKAQENIPVTGGQVPGESGFYGLSGHQQAAVNKNIDLEPPDQGLCAGNGDIGEFINNAIAFYDPAGHQLAKKVPSYAFFKKPASDFFSDPRCYYDASTRRWFFTEFVLPIFTSTAPPTQFLAISNSPNPLGSYRIWSIPTADRSTAGCPCFGDFDQLGVDNNGIYISTNEFGLTSGAYNGVIIYAVSKQTIEQFSHTGIPPTLFTYRIPVDNFGAPYHIAPSETPPGAKFAPNTEYFVETNANAFSDNHLEVYAMHNTSDLATPAAPPLFGFEVKSERYAFPPDATQKAGPIPLGKANQDPEGQLQADFDAIQEVTYTGGKLYAEADTATGSGAGAAWFELTPKLTSAGLTATVSHEGYVTVKGQNLIYPVIAVNGAGHGYMSFTLSGHSYYPSAAYVRFLPTGPSGDIHVAAAGAGPEDSFTCYAAFVGPNYGGCRWGDYSMGVAMGSRVYQATEVVPPTGRDYLTNWGTFIWGAPAP